MAKILLIIAQKGYQIMEYENTKKVLEDNGHVVVTASNEKGIATSDANTTTSADISINDVNVNDYDGIYLIGGPLVPKYLNNEIVYSILRKAHDNPKIFYGAICISPRILILAGVVKGLEITGWNGDGDLPKTCKENGVIYNDSPVVISGRVITAEGPLSAYGFGQAISKQFK